MNSHFPFHTIIILAYTFPNIYLFVRIWQLFIEKGSKIRYSIIYLLLAMVFPLSNLFSGDDAAYPAFTVASNYLLPFYLYLFLSVLVFDIFLLINRLVKIFPRAKMSVPRIRKICLGSILFVSFSIVIAGIINFNTIRISEYQIGIPRRSSSIKHLKVAYVADFHIKGSQDIDFVRKFAGKIEEIKPDIMLFGGDIVEGRRSDKYMQLIQKILSGIKTRYGSYGVYGNHEYYTGQVRGDFFDKAGITILCDTVMVIDGLFSLAGRFDSHSSYRKTVSALLSSASDTLPVILLDHRPTEIDQASRTAADIQFSGHTHNGQLFPINLITGSIYELSWGYLKKGNTNFFVTSGIRLWGPPVRTTGKSEILVIDIDFQ